MLRYLMPYVVVALAVAAFGGAAYGAGVAGVAGFYLTVTVATVVAGGGYARWEARHPDRGAGFGPDAR